jgi:transketolase C-terminal domain/subunit
MVNTAMQAAEILSEHGIEAMVINAPRATHWQGCYS